MIMIKSNMIISKKHTTLYGFNISSMLGKFNYTKKTCKMNQDQLLLSVTVLFWLRCNKHQWRNPAIAILLFQKTNKHTSTITNFINSASAYV